MGQEGAHGDPIGLYRTGPPPSALGSGNEAAPEAAAPAGAPDSAGGSLSGGSLPGGSLPGTSTAGRVQSRGAGVRGTPPRTRVSLARGSRHACYTPARAAAPLAHVHTRVTHLHGVFGRCHTCKRACYRPARGSRVAPVGASVRVTCLCAAPARSHACKSVLRACGWASCRSRTCEHACYPCEAPCCLRTYKHARYAAVRAPCPFPAYGHTNYTSARGRIPPARTSTRVTRLLRTQACYTPAQGSGSLAGQGIRGHRGGHLPPQGFWGAAGGGLGAGLAPSR